MINKRSILIFLVLLILFNIHSQDNKIHIPELVKTFPWGKVGGAFGRWTGETPTAFTFDNTGKMYALDVRNKRISVFDSNFEFIRNILPSTTVYYKNRIYIDDNNDIITVNYAQDGAISKIDQNGKKKFHLNFNLLKIHGLQIKKTIVRYNDIYLEKNGDTYVLENPDQIIGTNLKLSKKSREFKMDPENLQGSDFMGQDSEKNSYWIDKNGKISIFSSNGSMIESFKYECESQMNVYCIHPNGDIYFIGNDYAGVNLFRIKHEL